MVPVYAHRYLPAGRGSFGHPVLSMWQTDVTYYGVDLADYMYLEFDEVRGEVDDSWNPRTTAPFWQDLL
ncbi:SMI1/KNR4 family protein OS=Streptomyces pilosus OX=28893 GN=GCM10010280_63130 PE=4 SV=1 [Streptomyces pilosus]